MIDNSSSLSGEKGQHHRMLMFRIRESTSQRSATNFFDDTKLAAGGEGHREAKKSANSNFRQINIMYLTLLLIFVYIMSIK